MQAIIKQSVGKRGPKHSTLQTGYSSAAIEKPTTGFERASPNRDAYTRNKEKIGQSFKFIFDRKTITKGEEKEINICFPALIS